MSKPTRWRWVMTEDRQRLYDVGRNDDGTLHNPNGYPEELVRDSIARAERRRHERRSAAARKAAETRRKRRDAMVYHAAQRLTGGEPFGPGGVCVICGRGLTDAESINRSIGSDCWQDVLGVMNRSNDIDGVTDVLRTFLEDRGNSMRTDYTLAGGE